MQRKGPEIDLNTLEKKIAYFYGLTDLSKVSDFYLKAYQWVTYSSSSKEEVKQQALPMLECAYQQVIDQSLLKFNVQQAAALEFDLIWANHSKASYEARVGVTKKLYALVFNQPESHFIRPACLRVFLYQLKGQLIEHHLLDLDTAQCLIELSELSATLLNARMPKDSTLKYCTLAQNADHGALASLQKRLWYPFETTPSKSVSVKLNALETAYALFFKEKSVIEEDFKAELKPLVRALYAEGLKRINSPCSIDEATSLAIDYVLSCKAHRPFSIRQTQLIRLLTKVYGVDPSKPSVPAMIQVFIGDYIDPLPSSPVSTRGSIVLNKLLNISSNMLSRDNPYRLKPASLNI